MTPSQQAKAAGLKSLKELSEISSSSCRTLINWNRDRPQLFATVLAGAIVIKNNNNRNEGLPKAVPLECRVMHERMICTTKKKL